jgi:hypothetical protein
VAVAVEHAPFVALDSGNRIVEVGSHAESQFGPLSGRVLWDCFPGTEQLFRPYYDRARTAGETVEFVQFYDGFVVRVRASPREGDELVVHWEQLARIDPTTLETLATSLSAALAVLDEEQRDVHREDLRTALRLIEGGA